MSKSKVRDFIEDYISYKMQEDEEQVKNLLEESKEEYVKLDEVGVALVDTMDDLVRMIDGSQALTEVRMKAIVNSLPEETREMVIAEFDAASDTLFTEEGEEIENE